MSRLQEAVLWAAELHAGQDREGRCPLPYVTHPIDVLSRIRAAGVDDEDVLCAAALHDVVEECGVAFGEIERRLGARVAGLVRELTRREPSPGQLKGLSKDEIWQLRAEMLLEDISQMSPDAMVVKLGDRLSNLDEAQRTKAGPALARYIVQSRRISKIIPKDVHPGLHAQLRRAVKAAEKAAGL